MEQVTAYVDWRLRGLMDWAVGANLQNADAGHLVDDPDAPALDAVADVTRIDLRSVLSQSASRAGIARRHCYHGSIAHKFCKSLHYRQQSSDAVAWFGGVDSDLVHFSLLTCKR